MMVRPIDPTKIYSCYEKIKQILDGQMPVPRTVEFFISNACNHSCIGCHSKSLHKLNDKFLKKEEAFKVIKELATMGVESIEISGGGEPLLHPNIVEIINFINKKRLKAGMFTNGIFLNEQNAIEIVKKLTFIRIALDASNPALYKMVHGKEDFYKLIKNIKMLVRTRNNYSTCTIGLKYLISMLNHKDLYDAALLGKKLKADYFQYSMLRKSKFELKRKVLPFLEKQVRKMTMLRTKEYEIFGRIYKTKVIGRCFLNVLHPLIDASGNVYLCAFFQHRKESHKIGNIYNKSFSKIWYSKKHRRAFIETNPKECSYFDCPMHEPATLIKGGMIDGKKHLEFI